MTTTFASEAPWSEAPTVELGGAIPPRDRFRAVPPTVLEHAKNLLADIRRMIPPETRRLATLVRARTLNRFHDEFAALANLIDADWRDIVVANLSYDLVISAFGCSTVALATKSGPVLARNMDWWPEDLLARASCLVSTRTDGQLLYANAGWPGAVGVVSGLSGRGFGLVLNAVNGPEGKNLLGYPVMLHLRRVLEDAGGFDEALEMLSRPKLATPCLVTLVGTKNDERVVVERSPTRCALRRPQGDEPLVCTNDYRLLFSRPQAADGDNELARTACSRFDALTGCFARGTTIDRDVSDEELLYALTDPGVLAGITAQHVVLRPRFDSIRLWTPRRLLA